VPLKSNGQHRQTEAALRIMHDRVLDRDYYDFCKVTDLRQMFANELYVHWPLAGDPKEVTAFDVWMMSPNRNQYFGGSEFRPLKSCRTIRHGSRNMARNAYRFRTFRRRMF